MSTLYVNAGLVPKQKRFPDTIKNSWIIRKEYKQLSPVRPIDIP